MLILEHLMHDCRISTTRLAKLVGLSQPTVVYRISKLEKEYIEKYDMIVNYNKLDLKIGCFLITVPHDECEEFERFCKDNDKVITMGVAVHKRNYYVQALEEFRQELKYYYDYYRYNKSEILPFSVSETLIEYKPTKNDAIIDLDEFDKMIIKHLSDGGGRDSVLKIARDTGLSSDLVLYRFRKLRNAGYFSLFIAQPSKRFHINYIVAVFETDSKDVQKKIRRLNKALFFADLDGRYTVTFAIKDLEEYQKTLKTFYKIFGDKLIKSEIYPIFNSLFANRLNFL